ncbi:hypothetical protein ACOMHN_034424 [Nucella lapillus]
MASADVETGRVADVISSRHRTQKEQQRTRRYSRKTSEDSELSPRAGIPASDHRRRSRPEGIRNLIHRRQQAALRRSSESALLPPIRVASLHQTGSSPTRDANETSSPTSNVTFPVGGGDHNASGPPDTGSSILATLQKHESRSPSHRNAPNSRGEPPDPCLSPTANSDHVRLLAERRMLKSVKDTMKDLTVPKSPTAPVIENGAGTLTPRQIARNKINRRVSMQSLPKLSTSEEPFSIRRKIEQFRKWHEEQYTEKLKKLKVDAEGEKEESADGVQPPPTQTPSLEIDFAKILEDNMKNSHPHNTHSKNDSNGNPTPEKTSAEVTSKKPTRCKSGASWRSWRDVNDSYAYSDVAKYIEDNELLPADRVTWINDWIGEVEKALNGPKEDWDEEDVFGS